MPQSTSFLSCSPAPHSSKSVSSSSTPLKSFSCSISPQSSPSYVWRHLLLAIVLISMYCCSTTEACFIRNCPKGGKRSMESLAVGQRPCLSCGPGNTGQCVGPKICCSPQFGCYFGTPDAEVCEKENESTTPCYISGDVCGSRDSGKCVAQGVCCDSASCAFNERCSGETAQEGSPDKGKILRLIQRLLQTKNYDD